MNTKIFCYLVLGIIVGALLFYLIDRKLTVPAITVVDVANREATPIIRVNQKLRWEGIEGGEPFVVKFSGQGPCKERRYVSHTEGGRQVAECKVLRVPEGNRHFSYGIAPYTPHMTDDDDVRTCPGCNYYAESSVMRLVQDQKTTSSSRINVDCKENVVTLDQVDTNIDDIASKRITWSPGENVPSFSIAFTGSQEPQLPKDPDCTVGKYACDFSNSHNYTYIYTLTVVTEQGKPCYNMSAKGTVWKPKP